ncbi:hypothetical protein, partial [Pseudoruegeria sp. SK021]|uniref:hypothetical protein n=1 Tax=Pseudoruegeria sp. SK021 TaxID=1933035 RepID=UPI0019816E55
MQPAPLVVRATSVFCPRRKISMMRMGPPQQGHGSRRVSGVISGSGSGAAFCSVSARFLPQRLVLDTCDDVGLGDEVFEEVVPFLDPKFDKIGSILGRIFEPQHIVSMGWSLCKTDFGESRVVTRRVT